jgi:general secretion pathway protein J
LSSIWHNNRGFTLLELLVALVLLVILGAALYGSYFSVMRGREAANREMEHLRELRVTLDQLRRELSSAFYSRENPRLHFVVEDRDYFGKPASTLDFTCITPPLESNLPVSDQVRATYKAEEKENGLLLSRSVKDLYATLDPLPYPQMNNLEGFLVECSADGTKWVRTWDTALNARMPGYIKVTLMVKEGEKTVGFSTIASPRIGS